MSQIHGQVLVPGETTRWEPIQAVLQPDGNYALKCDTELVLDSSNISISNIKVGSVNQTVASSRYLRVLDDGTVVVSVVSTDPLEGYKAARSQDSGSFPHYFGMVNEVEDWVIIRESRSGNISTFEYFTGSLNFTTNWGNKAALVYDEYFNIF